METSAVQNGDYLFSSIFFFPIYMLTLYPELPLAREAEFLSFVSAILVQNGMFSALPERLE